MTKGQIQKVITVLVFAIAFGLLEAIVVIYLRRLLTLPPGFIPTFAPDQFFINLGFIAFSKPETFSLFGPWEIVRLEFFRNVSTLLILATVALLAGKTIKERLAYFLISFAIWDIFYYVFLRVFTGWPATLVDLDILFLIPVPWIAPVIIPVVASVLMIIVGINLLQKK